MHQRDSATSIFDHPCNSSSEASHHTQGNTAASPYGWHAKTAAPRGLSNTSDALGRSSGSSRLAEQGQKSDGEGMEDIDICPDRYHDIIHKSYIYNPHYIYKCKINISTVLQNII